MNRDRRHAQLVSFLRHELAVSEAAIAIALKHEQQDTSSLPMILWQYGLVSIDQLSQIFDWLKDEALATIHQTLSRK